MGCRESKLDVVTGNTVVRSKESKSDAKRIASPETRPDDKTGGLAAATEGGDSETVNGKEGESRELDRKKIRGAGRRMRTSCVIIKKIALIQFKNIMSLLSFQRQ